MVAEITLLLALSCPSGPPVATPTQPLTRTAWDGVHATRSPGRVALERSPIYDRGAATAGVHSGGPYPHAVQVGAQQIGQLRAAEIRQSRVTISTGLKWDIGG